MDSRLMFFLLGAIVVAGVSAADRECPQGFRCAGVPVPGQVCQIEEGPFRGETGTLVDGRCLRSSDAGGSAGHTHVIDPGHCPLCGGTGEEFLAFNVSVGHGGRTPGGSARRLLRCTTCANLFTDLP